METFDEYSEIGKEIMLEVRMFLWDTKTLQGVSFKEPFHDIARRFLNEIVEFKPLKEKENL